MGWVIYLLHFCSKDMGISKRCPNQLYYRCRWAENQAGPTIGLAPSSFLPWAVRFPLMSSVSFSHPCWALVRASMFVYNYSFETLMLYHFMNVTFPFPDVDIYLTEVQSLTSVIRQFNYLFLMTMYVHMYVCIYVYSVYVFLFYQKNVFKWINWTLTWILSKIYDCVSIAFLRA